MEKLIPDFVRKGIIDELILIGHVPGQGTYRAFFQRVYPKSAEIKRNAGTLLDEIGRHCDMFSGDWGDDTGIFEMVDIFNWTDQEFLYFCEEYVNPVFNRVYWDEEKGERINLQTDCVAAINTYLRDCGYELKQKNRIADKVQYALTELSGVKGKIHNIVFAAIQKPDLLLKDVLNLTVEIPHDDEKYLLYDEEVTIEGLTWEKLKEWYNTNSSLDETLEKRLQTAVNHCGSPIEEKVLLLLYGAFRGIRYGYSRFTSTSIFVF